MRMNKVRVDRTEDGSHVFMSQKNMRLKLLLQDLAEEAAQEFDDTCTFDCHIPWVRGAKIHKLFEHKVKLAGNGFDAEVSYLNGSRVNHGRKGSSRADAIYGLPAAPEFAIELKTGYFAFVSDRQINNYKQNLPSNTVLYLMWVR